MRELVPGGPAPPGQMNRKSAATEARMRPKPAGIQSSPRAMFTMQSCEEGDDRRGRPAYNLPILAADRVNASAAAILSGSVPQKASCVLELVAA